MSEEIRIGVLVRARFAQIRRDAVAAFEREHPGVFFNDGWRRRTDGPHAVFWDFESALLEEAGGVDRLLAEWEFQVRSVSEP